MASPTIANITSALETMQRIGMPLLVHGEVTDKDIDIFDREAVFIDRVMSKITANFPDLKTVFEHITTKDAVDFVMESGPNIAATITPHHLVYNRSAIFEGGINPHLYCLPIAKRELHRLALRAAATSGSPKFFLGTDSAPHVVAAQTNRRVAARVCSTRPTPSRATRRSLSKKARWISSKVSHPFTARAFTACR